MGISVGVAVGSAVGVSVGNGVAVSVGVSVGISVGISVAVGSAVGVSVGREVAVLVGVSVGTSVGVSVAVGSTATVSVIAPLASATGAIDSAPGRVTVSDWAALAAIPRCSATAAAIWFAMGGRGAAASGVAAGPSGAVVGVPGADAATVASTVGSSVAVAVGSSVGVAVAAAVAVAVGASVAVAAGSGAAWATETSDQDESPIHADGGAGVKAGMGVLTSAKISAERVGRVPPSRSGTRVAVGGTVTGWGAQAASNRLRRMPRAINALGVRVVIVLSPPAGKTGNQVFWSDRWWNF